MALLVLMACVKATPLKVAPVILDVPFPKVTCTIKIELLAFEGMVKATDSDVLVALPELDEPKVMGQGIAVLVGVLVAVLVQVLVAVFVAVLVGVLVQVKL